MKTVIINGTAQNNHMEEIVTSTSLLGRHHVIKAEVEALLLGLRYAPLAGLLVTWLKIILLLMPPVFRLSALEHCHN